MAGIALPDRAAIAQAQLASLRSLLAQLLPANPFYAKKFAGVAPAIESLDDFSARFPFTLKSELVADQQAQPPYGTNLTYPVSAYSRFHQTSGTSGVPLRWLDTPQSWQWMLDNWQRIYQAAGVTSQDRIYFAFSFGPFLGFWTAFESATRMGALCLPGGGMSSAARVRAILDNQATALCCTPTYALRLAQVAAEEQIDLRASAIKKILVAGEPGGSIPQFRQRLESLWPGARVVDHHGMTEVGPVTYECPAQPGTLHVIESAYYAEVLPPAGSPLLVDGMGELVLTTLGRIGSPLLRYRTGDLVQAVTGSCPCGTAELALRGGIIGRTDDMVVVRGVNVYPNAVDEIIRQYPEIVEYRVRIDGRNSLIELSVEIEPAESAANPTDTADRLQKQFQTQFALRLPVTLAAVGSLPRFEMKSRRWVRTT